MARSQLGTARAEALEAAAAAVAEPLEPTPQPRALFAVRVRERGAAATDLVLDALEDAKVDEDNWDWVVWYRGQATYAVMSAPLLARGVLVSTEGIEVLPVASVADKMEDNRNEWVEPRASASKTAIERAKLLLSEWSGLQFIQGAEEIVPEVILTGKPKERTKIASRSQVLSRRRGRGEVRAQQANTAQALGLDKATDETGQGFTFHKLE